MGRQRSRGRHRDQRPSRLVHAGADLFRRGGMAGPGVLTHGGASGCWSKSLGSSGNQSYPGSPRVWHTRRQRLLAMVSLFPDMYVALSLHGLAWPSSSKGKIRGQSQGTALRAVPSCAEGIRDVVDPDSEAQSTVLRNPIGSESRDDYPPNEVSVTCPCASTWPSQRKPVAGLLTAIV
jgi:hypothetical protein